MVICSLDALKRYSKKKETINKLVTIERDRDDEILGFDLGIVGYNNTTLALISSFAIIFFIMRRVSYLKNRLCYVEITAF